MSSFLKFVLYNKENRRFLFIAVAIALIEWIIFKYLYPYPDFFSDSYSYLYAGSQNLDLNIWPIGYSKFLWLFHHISHGDIALVSFQFALLEISALYFFFTLLFYYRCSQFMIWVLLITLFSNPLLLFLCNYVNSDGLFAAASLLWITELIRIVNRPRIYQVFVQGILLFLAFTVRNNAYIYPLIALLAFLLSPGKPSFKIAGILLGPLLMIPFIWHTRAEAKRVTGTSQYSLFTGWQLANNALYMRPYITPGRSELTIPISRELDSLAVGFLATINDKDAFRAYLSSYPGNYYIIESRAPLKIYLGRHYRISDHASIISAWGRSSSVFENYGRSLIENHPWAFTRYFLLLNAGHYFLPPLEKLLTYNMGADSVRPIARDWFDYKSAKVSAISYSAQGYILYIFPILFCILHLYLLGFSFSLLYKRQYRLVSTKSIRMIFLLGSFLVLNLLFCVFATIIVLRYEVFPMIILVTNVVLLRDLFKSHRIYPVVDAEASTSLQ